MLWVLENMQRLYQSGLNSMQYEGTIIYLPCLNYYVRQQFLGRRNRHSFRILWHEESVVLKEKLKTNWFLKDNSISIRPWLPGMTDRCHTATFKPRRTLICQRVCGSQYGCAEASGNPESLMLANGLEKAYREMNYNKGLCFNRFIH